MRSRHTEISYGGGGGGSNSPSKKGLPECTTSLVSIFCLIQLSSADRIQLNQPIFLCHIPIGIRTSAPRLFDTQSQPAEKKSGGCVAFIKLHYAKTGSPFVFCHLFCEVSGTSACNSVGPSLSKPHAPIFSTLLFHHLLRSFIALSISLSTSRRAMVSLLS